jgi:hypothetical protein
MVKKSKRRAQKLVGKKKYRNGEREQRLYSRRKVLSILGFFGLATAEQIWQRGAADPLIDFIKVKAHRWFDHGEAIMTQELHKRIDLIFKLFLESEADTEFVPPQDWDHARPDVILPNGVRTYGHEFEVLQAIATCFPREQVAWEYQDRSWPVHENNSQVFLASGVSNAGSRLVIGTPDNPILDPRLGDKVVQLEYGIRRGNGQLIRWQYNELIQREALAICDRSKNIVLQAELTKPLQHDDYLLVTRIPGPRPKTIYSVFSGLQGPGTRATEMLFSKVSVRDLEELASRIGYEGGEVPCFQAVFRASKLEKINGSSVATHIELVTEGCPPKRLANKLL